MATAITRSVIAHSNFGHPASLCNNQLPTSGDVFRAYHNYAQISKKHTLQERTALVAKEIKEIYDRASIPTIGFGSIMIRVRRLVAKVHKTGKYSDTKKSSGTYHKFMKSFDSLFDICACKCFDSGARERSACNCPLICKIPSIEWVFWVDQKTSRKMFIGEVDKEVTAMQQKRENRLKKTTMSTCADKKIKHNTEVIESEVEVSDHEKSTTDDEFIVGAMSSDEEPEIRNHRQYPELCKAMDRCKISNRDACLIANAILKDLSLLTEKSAIDPAKLRRQRDFWRKKEVEKQLTNTKELICIGFDGKRDVALSQISNVRRKINEEHYVIIAYPGETYIDHVTPVSCKAFDVATEIISIITKTNSLKTVAAVVCDGTVNNTGKRSGVIRRLEEHLGRPLQWSVCLLHAIELPFRRYVSVVDGGCTTGPSTSSGKVSMELNYDPMDLPIVNFKPIPGKVIDLSDDVMADLSTDQLYLLKACLAVQQGFHITEHISYLQAGMPGNLSNSRWLTKANRILRLYMSKQVSSEELYRITRFILNVYAPSWFQVKQYSSCVDGARNFFYLMKRCYELGHGDLEIVEPVLQNNSYFAHPENIILAGLTDDDDCNRKFVCVKLIEARKNVQPNAIRVFDKSIIKLNFSALSYVDMIDWTAAVVTPPPLLANISNEDIEQLQVDSFKGIPCHSQAVERCIKDVSATSLKVFGHKSRHGMIMQCIRSRNDLYKIDSKSDFLLCNN